jgi:hypothetical protein
MPDKFEEPLRVLGLAPGATGQAIKEAYRDLVKVWHPDRFGSDERLRAKAEERLKEVNDAFEQLRGYRPSDSRPSRETAAPVDVPQPTVGYRAKDPLTGALPLLLFLAALAAFVGTWFFISGPPGTQQPSLVNEAVTPAATGETGVPAVPPQLRRAAPETASGTTDSVPESAAVPTTGSLHVASRPMGARVSFDGRVVGETPMVLTDLTPGEHQIGLDLDAKGYQPWSSSVLVTAGLEEKLLAVMTPKERAGEPGQNGR